MKRVALLLLLALPSLGLAGDLGLPESVKGKPGKWLVVEAKTKAAAVVWIAADDALDIFPDGLLVDAHKTVVLSGTPGSYKLWAVAYDGAKLLKDYTTVVIDGPVPPGPTPPGPTPPGPTPIPPAKGFRVLFVVEKNDPLTKEQLNIWNSTAIKAYLREKCTKDGTQPAFRFWDKDTPKDGELDVWKSLWAASGSALTITGLPAIIIVTDQVGDTVRWPATEAETLALLKRYAEGSK